MKRLKAMSCVVMSSATTVTEACWLERAGVDAVIAQGYEAGGHRGMFLTEDLAAQVGTFALIPQVVDAVKVPVIAAGAIADARGIAAALALGAAGVQIGSAYLWCAEAKISAPHRAALATMRDDGTAVTNVMTGRPARGIVNRVMREIGPISDVAPEFPLAAGALAPLRSKAETQGSGDFSPMWAGQAAALGRAMGAGELTRRLAAEALERMRALGCVARGVTAQARTMRRRVPQGSEVSSAFDVAVIAAAACCSRDFTVSKAASSEASSASQDNPARFLSRCPAPALCQTLPAM